MPSGRGSSSSSYVLAEAIRAGTGAGRDRPARGRRHRRARAPIVAGELYGVAVPVVVADAATYRRIADGAALTVRADDDGALLETS